MRRRSAVKKQVLPDPVHGSEVLSKFINHVMKSGKKSTAEAIVYGALNAAMQRVKSAGNDKKSKDEESESDSGSHAGGARNVLDLFEIVLDQIRPTVEVKSRRVGGSTYQVPIEVNGLRGTALAMRWLVDAAVGRSEKSMKNKLAAEMFEAYNGRGSAVKKRDDTHRMAKANQAFAHYRW